MEAAVTLSRMKMLGVALGTGAVVASSTAAYACFPDGSTTTSAPRTAAVTTAFELDADTAGTVAQRRLAELTELVQALQAKVASVGTPATITAREAGRIKATIALITALQDKLATMSVSSGDATTVALLQSSLSTLAGRLRAVLATATVVAPVVKADPLTKVSDRFLAARFRLTHLCDRNGFHRLSADRWGSGDYRHHYDRYGDRHR